MSDQLPGQVISPNGTSDQSAQNAMQPEQSAQQIQPTAAPQDAITNQPQPAPTIAPQPTLVSTPVAPQPTPVSPVVPTTAPITSEQPVTPTIQPAMPVADVVQQSQPNQQTQSYASPELPVEEPPVQANFDPTDDGALQDDTQFDTIRWTASEYIAHQKTTAWYVGLAVATIALLAVVFFVTSGDIISMVSIGLAAVVFGMYAGRKPKTQEYTVGPRGVGIGAKMYSYDRLRSFAVVSEGAFSNITFMPLKRFMSLVSIYYDPQDEDRILAALSLYLPMEERRKDAIDRLTSRIKF